MCGQGGDELGKGIGNKDKEITFSAQGVWGKNDKRKRWLWQQLGWAQKGARQESRKGQREGEAGRHSHKQGVSV